MAAFYDPPRYNFTVKTFRQAAGRARNRVSSNDPNCEIDHIIELQLVVKALNRLEKPEGTNDDSSWLTELMDFFNEDDNLERVSKEYNREKGKAVKGWLAGKIKAEQKEALRLVYLPNIRNAWDFLRNGLMRDHGIFSFVEEMDIVLEEGPVQISRRAGQPDEYVLI